MSDGTGPLPMPAGPPNPDVIYPAREAVAWIRTMTPGALVKAAKRDPKRFPSTKPGKEVGFSGRDIVAITEGFAREAKAQSQSQRVGPHAVRPQTPQPSTVTHLRAQPGRARKTKKSA